MKKETLSDRQSTPIMAWLIIGFAGLGGILYGYDIGVISGALIFMKKEIQLTPREISLIVAAVLGGGPSPLWLPGPWRTG